MGMRDELKEMAEGFRWGRRPLVPAIGRAVRRADGGRGRSRPTGRAPARASLRGRPS